MRPEPPVAGAVGSSRTAPAWRKPMYPPNLDAFHQIYLDRSQRAIADAEAHRHAAWTRRRHPVWSGLGRAARRLTGVRVRTPEPQPASTGDA
jgi:hypothetical protein